MKELEAFRKTFAVQGWIDDMNLYVIDFDNSDLYNIEQYSHSGQSQIFMMK